MKDLHTHTTFSDGKNTPEEMVQAAIRAGLTEYGISDHGYTPFDESYCMPQSRYGEYLAALAGLREKYKGQISLRLGMEQDFYSVPAPQGLDYVIGSVHYLRCGDAFVPVDEDAAILRGAVSRYFGGDPYALCEQYFDTVSRVAEKTGARIIGHFDLVAKFNQQSPWFDEQHPRYRAAWQKAMRTLVPSGAVFEVNWGARNRGLRTVPYLTDEMQAYLTALGGRMLPSSDAHRAEDVGKFG